MCVSCTRVCVPICAYVRACCVCADAFGWVSLGASVYICVCVWLCACVQAHLHTHK